MKVKILKVATAEEVAALIKKGKVAEMPSIQQDWRFNFDKELKKLKNATGYLLVTEDTPDVIEGCMIFQLRDKKEPYMAFVEVAPHNKKDKKRYDRVAGCLIAYAYQLSLTEGWEHFKGYLQFDVMEQDKEDEKKLMSVYSSKYHAQHIKDTTTMVIVDEAGDTLIAEYLTTPEDKKDGQNKSS
jgi:hypothetical protein